MKGREAWRAAVHHATESDTTEPVNSNSSSSLPGPACPGHRLSSLMAAASPGSLPLPLSPTSIVTRPYCFSTYSKANPRPSNPHAETAHHDLPLRPSVFTGTSCWTPKQAKTTPLRTLAPASPNPSFPSEPQSTVRISTPASSYCGVTVWRLPLFLFRHPTCSPCRTYMYDRYDTGLGSAMSVYFPGLQSPASARHCAGRK